MKKCPKPLGYGIRRTPVVLGLSAALCMPAAFSYANVDNGMDRESVLSVMQGKTIKGQILDETGESMIGVSVLVKGTTIGTVTDFDGNYTLEVPSGKNILEISYIGYKTKEITIGNNSLINIKMEPDTQALDEVVVIGYGTVKKRDLTGAVASMKNEDVTVAPTSNVMEALCVAGIHLAYMGVGDFHVGGDRFQIIPVEITAHSLFPFDEVRTELGCWKRRTLCRTNGVAAGTTDGGENLVSYPSFECFSRRQLGSENKGVHATFIDNCRGLHKPLIIRDRVFYPILIINVLRNC